MTRVGLFILLCGCGARTQLDVDKRTSVDASCDVPRDVLAYYPLDQDTLDHSGNHHDASGIAFAKTAGKLGGAMHFSGEGVLKIDNGPDLAPRTLCAWVRPSSTSGLGQPVFTGGASGSGDFFSVAASSAVSGTCKSLQAGTPFVDHWGNADCAKTALSLGPNAWHLVCFAYGGADLVIYADGQQWEQSSSLCNYSLSTMTLGSSAIGGTTTAPALDGDLDEVTIWARALDAAELAQLWNSGVGCAYN